MSAYMQYDVLGTHLLLKVAVPNLPCLLRPPRPPGGTGGWHVPPEKRLFPDGGLRLQCKHKPAAHAASLSLSKDMLNRAKQAL
jgi:hypothetical protein